MGVSQKPHDNSISLHFIDHGWKHHKFPPRERNHILHVSFINCSRWRWFISDPLVVDVHLSRDIIHPCIMSLAIFIFLFASEKISPSFSHRELQKMKEFLMKNHIRDGAGCQRHSHSSLMFIYRRTETCSTCHLTTVRNSTEPDSSSYLQQGLFLIAFFSLSQTQHLCCWNIT